MDQCSSQQYKHQSSLKGSYQLTLIISQNRQRSTKLNVHERDTYHSNTPNSFTLRIHNLNSIPIQHLFKSCFSVSENSMYYHAQTLTYCNLQFLETAHHDHLQLIMFCILTLLRVPEAAVTV